MWSVLEGEGPWDKHPLQIDCGSAPQKVTVLKVSKDLVSYWHLRVYYLNKVITFLLLLLKLKLEVNWCLNVSNEAEGQARAAGGRSRVWRGCRKQTQTTLGGEHAVGQQDKRMLFAVLFRALGACCYLKRTEFLYSPPPTLVSFLSPSHHPRYLLGCRPLSAQHCCRWKLPSSLMFYCLAPPPFSQLPAVPRPNLLSPELTVHSRLAWVRAPLGPTFRLVFPSLEALSTFSSLFPAQCYFLGRPCLSPLSEIRLL